MLPVGGQSLSEVYGHIFTDDKLVGASIERDPLTAELSREPGIARVISGESFAKEPCRLQGKGRCHWMAEYAAFHDRQKRFQECLSRPRMSPAQDSQHFEEEELGNCEDFRLIDDALEHSVGVGVGLI